MTGLPKARGTASGIIDAKIDNIFKTSKKKKKTHRKLIEDCRRNWRAFTAIAYAAVRDVIEKGVLLDYHSNHKGRKYDSALVAAPITINNERFVCVVVLHHNLKNNKYYLHEVTSQKYLLSEEFKTGMVTGSKQGDVAKLLQNIVTAKEPSKIVGEKQPRSGGI